MTSAENNVSEPPNLKIFRGRITPHPPTRLLPSALVIISQMIPQVRENLATALHSTTSFCKNVGVAETTYKMLARGFSLALRP